MNFGGATIQPLTTYIKGQPREKEQKNHPGKEQEDARSEKSGGTFLRQEPGEGASGDR